MGNTSPGAVLITGGARRIGRALAVDLAGQGWTVAVHYNGSHADACAIVDEIGSRGGQAVAVAADLSDEDQAAALIDRATASAGRLTALINNASVFERDEVTTVTRDSWHHHMQVNLRSPFVLIQHFLLALGEDTRGNVINILDQRVWNLTPHFTSYTLSKAGLWTLTQTLALALAPHVRVNAVGPGPVLPSPRQSDAQFERQWASVPLARPVAPQEICDAVRFLLDAPSVTGQMIAVDAGQHLRSPASASSGEPEE